jgi:hypothetical protein
MRLRNLFLWFVLLLTVLTLVRPAITASQTGDTKATVEIPATPAGKLFAAWLESFNSGDREKVLSFQSAHFPKQADPEKRLNRAMGLHSQTGGFDLKKIESSSPYQISGVVKEKNSDNLAHFELLVSTSDPSQIDNFGLNLISAANTADSKPPERMPAKQLRKKLTPSWPSSPRKTNSLARC